MRTARGEYAESLDDARDTVGLKTRDDEEVGRDDGEGGWFPAEIWTAGISDVIGVGELVETVGSIVVVVDKRTE